MLEREYSFYQAHKDELLATHHGQWVVITGDKIHGYYNTNEQAYKAGVTELGLGQFLMQHVLEDELLAVTLYSLVHA